MFKNLFKNKKIETAKKAIEKDSKNIIKLSILADLYIETNAFNDAIDILNKILTIDEKYFPALEKLGKLYIKTKEYLKAFYILKKLYEFNNNDFRIKTLFFSLKDANCDKEIKTEILLGLLEFEENIELKKYLAKIYLETGQFSKSANTYENLLSIDDNSIYLLELSKIYYKLQKWKKASETLEKLMLTENFTMHHSEILAEVYFKELRYQEAIEIYELLIKTNSSKKEFYKKKITEIHLQQNNPDKALEETSSLIEENQYSVDAKFLTVQALYDKKEYAQAVEYLREFYFDPLNKENEQKIIQKIIEASILHAQQLSEEKKYTQAIDALAIALRYDEENKNIYFELAKISTAIKDYSSAKEYQKIAENLS